MLWKGLLKNSGRKTRCRPERWQRLFFVGKYNDKDGMLLSIEEIDTNGIGHCALAKLFPGQTAY